MRLKVFGGTNGKQSLKCRSYTGISSPDVRLWVLWKWIYCICVEREGVEEASESLVFSSFINVLGNPASDCAASGRLFSAVLFIFVSEWAGAEAPSSPPRSLIPLCWNQEPGYCLRAAMALLSQPGTVNFPQYHGVFLCEQIPNSVPPEEKSLSVTNQFWTARSHCQMPEKGILH